MEEYVYRIRRKSDGHWYGKRPRFSKEFFHPIAGKTMSRRALAQTLKGQHQSFLNSVEIVKYRIAEDQVLTVSDLLGEK